MDTAMPADDLYVIVRNHEDQYSIWRAGTEIPAGWEAVEEPGPKDGRLSRINELWTDMRPRSLRERMREAATS